MRRFIFILMIALLPLRGWMGEAMATEMAAMNIAATQAVKTMATMQSPVENSIADCDMHTTQVPESTTTKTSCTHCQACHAAGLVPTVQTISFDKVLGAQPLTQVNQFASANLALGQKPPIL
jgi:mono/diheme cytochrome c family protein